MFGFQRHIFFVQFFLPDGGKQNTDRNGHNARHDGKERQIIDVLQAGHAAGGIQHTGDKQVQNATDRAHQVNDGIGAAAQGLGGDIRHEGHRRGTIGAHGDEQKAQYGNEQHQLGNGGMGSVAVIQNGQQHHKQDGTAGAAQDKWHPAAHAAAAAIADGAEERQQEQGQDVIRRHNDAGVSFIQVEGVGEDLGDDAVVHLPEGADGKKREPHQNGALVVQLHG